MTWAMSPWYSESWRSFFSTAMLRSRSVASVEAWASFRMTSLTLRSRASVSMPAHPIWPASM